MAVAGRVAHWNVYPAVGGVDVPSNNSACPATRLPMGCGILLETIAEQSLESFVSLEAFFFFFTSVELLSSKPGQWSISVAHNFRSL